MAYVFALWHAMHVLCIVSSSRFLNGRRATTHSIARIFQKVLRKSVDKPPSGVFFSLHDAAQHLLADAPDHGLRAGVAARPRRCRPRTRPYYRPTRRGNRVCVSSTTKPRSKEPRPRARKGAGFLRSEEQTSELQSLMRIPYAVFCLTKKKQTQYT